jgi:hypothetical protein
MATDEATSMGVGREKMRSEAGDEECQDILMHYLHILWRKGVLPNVLSK